MNQYSNDHVRKVWIKYLYHALCKKPYRLEFRNNMWHDATLWKSYKPEEYIFLYSITPGYKNDI